MRIDQQALATHLTGLSLDERKRLIETFEQTVPRPRLTKYMLKTRTEKQDAFLCMPHREILYGGAAGGAKTYALLMAALQYVDVPGYSALLLRRTYPELAKAEGFIDIAKEWLSGTDARWSERLKRWTFPTGGKPAKLEISHYEAGQRGREKQYGGQYHYIGIDELTEFEKLEYQFLWRSLRRPENLNVPIRMRAGTNPIGKGAAWVKQHFIISPDPYTEPETGRAFLPAKLSDNTFIDQTSYVKSLMNLDPYTRAQLLDGDWDAKPPGGKFRREWFKMVDALPAGMQKVRFWDLAATEPEPGKDPDYTVGLLMGLYNDIFYIIDVRRVRLSPRGVEDLIVQTAEIDGLEVDIWMEQEPGASGINTIDYYTRLLKRFSFHAKLSTGSKELRANPLSSQAEAGNVKLLKGERWIDDYLDEMELVFHGQHDDQADASSGAYTALVTGDVGEYVFAGGERTSPEW